MSSGKEFQTVGPATASWDRRNVCVKIRRHRRFTAQSTAWRHQYKSVSHVRREVQMSTLQPSC